MFTDENTEDVRFSRGQAYYEQGDKNSGSSIPFLSELNKESGFGEWTNPITYWKDKIVTALKPEQKQPNVSQTPISMASSHDGSNIVNNAINNPTALASPSINPAGSTGMSAGVTDMATATVPGQPILGQGLTETNKGLLVVAGITATVIALGYLLNRQPSN